MTLHRFVIGIDIGTSGCKSILVDELGQVADEAYNAYPLDMPRTGWFEQAPKSWWEAVQHTVLELSSRLPSGTSLAGIGLSGQMHGLVLLDRNGNTLRPCIIWADQRTQPQCERITALADGTKGLLGYTNNLMLTAYTAGKLLWVQEHEPEIFGRTWAALNPKDYIRYLLTNELATEVSDASGTGLFDVRRRRWSEPLLALLGIPQALLPYCYESTEITGTLSRHAAELLGLPSGLPVVGGGGDAIAQCIGTGLVRDDALSATIGTGGQVCVALNRYADNPEGRLQVFCNTIPGKWHAMGVMNTAGSAFKWFQEMLCQGMGDSSERLFELLDEEAALVEPGAGELLFLPYLNGERCPYDDPMARGAFIGFTRSHGRSHMTRSIMEGVGFALRDITAIMEQQDAGRVYLSGGGARSTLWRQIVADTLNKEVVTMDGAAYGGALGAAFIAGAGLGIWESVEQAAGTLRIASRQMPLPENVARYDLLYPIYHGLYETLRGAFHSLANLSEKPEWTEQALRQDRRTDKQMYSERKEA